MNFFGLHTCAPHPPPNDLSPAALTRADSRPGVFASDQQVGDPENPGTWVSPHSY